MNPATKNVLLDGLDTVRTTLAKTQRNRIEEGKTVSAAETEQALEYVVAGTPSMGAEPRGGVR